MTRSSANLILILANLANSRRLLGCFWDFFRLSLKLSNNDIESFERKLFFSYQALLLPPLYLGRIVRTLKGPKSAKVRSPHVVLSFNFAKIDKSVQIYSSRKNIEQTYVQLNEQVMIVISTALVVSFVGLLLADVQVE